MCSSPCLHNASAHLVYWLYERSISEIILWFCFRLGPDRVTNVRVFVYRPNTNMDDLTALVVWDAMDFALNYTITVMQNNDPIPDVCVYLRMYNVLLVSHLHSFSPLTHSWFFSCIIGAGREILLKLVHCHSFSLFRAFFLTDFPDLYSRHFSLYSGHKILLHTSLVNSQKAYSVSPSHFSTVVYVAIPWHILCRPATYVLSTYFWAE